MKKVVLEVKEPGEMRYKTVGDWYEDESTVFITSASMNHDYFDFPLLVHELIEWFLCNQAGITEEQVDEWDFAHLDEEDPGSMEGCPYREQHLAAMAVESMMLYLAKANPFEYDKAIEKVWIRVNRALNEKEE